MKKAVLLFIADLLIFRFAHAQQPDSIKIAALQDKLASTQEDTSRVKLLIELSEATFRMDREKSYAYAKQSSQLAEELQWEKGEMLVAIQYGTLYHYDLDMPNAISYGIKALEIAQKLHDIGYIVRSNALLGDTYYLMKNYEEALSYYYKNIAIAKQSGNELWELKALISITGILEANTDWQKLREIIQQAKPLAIKLNSRYHLATILLSEANLARQYDSHKSILLAQEAQKEFSDLKEWRWVAWVDVVVGEEYMRLRLKDSAVYHAQKALELTTKYNLPKEHIDAYRALSSIHSAFGDYKAAYENYLRYDSLSRKAWDMTAAQNMERIKLTFEQEKKDAVIGQKILRQRTLRNFSFAGLTALLGFSVIVMRQRNKVKKEKKHSDELLLNILPAETAEELKRTGVTKAKDFDKVTVMFTDFKNFTDLSENLTAQELVNVIHFCYSRFDEIISRHRLEKIKTIGDSYMCAGGLPVANTTHAEDCVRAALEIKDLMISENQKRTAKGEPFCEIRIGIHTGPVVAGIVGIKKFAYDIWGDTVNIASRMESSCEPGNINISGTTYEMVKDKFTFSHRGKIEAKNKGMIDMYFLESGPIIPPT